MMAVTPSMWEQRHLSRRFKAASGAKDSITTVQMPLMMWPRRGVMAPE